MENKVESYKRRFGSENDKPESDRTCSQQFNGKSVGIGRNRPRSVATGNGDGQAAGNGSQEKTYHNVLKSRSLDSVGQAVKI